MLWQTRATAETKKKRHENLKLKRNLGGLLAAIA